jgi:hypothetical protein
MLPLRLDARLMVHFAQGLAGPNADILICPLRDVYRNH